jgi:hydrogenase maturation protease
VHLVRDPLPAPGGRAPLTLVVVGVGNALRGDDAAGLAVAELVRSRVSDDVVVKVCEQEPSRLVDAWEGAAAAVVVDAASSAAEPGTVHRIDASAGEVPARVFRSSTHAFGVGDVVELARALGRLPERVIVYGIEGGDFAAGTGLSEPVTAALPGVVESVVSDVERLRETHSGHGG